jgi:hypothetical protein
MFASVFAKKHVWTGWDGLGMDWRRFLQLVVVVVDGNETLTDSNIYSVEPCTRHRVQAAWSDNKECCICIVLSKEESR